VTILYQTFDGCIIEKQFDEEDPASLEVVEISEVVGFFCRRSRGYQVLEVPSKFEENNIFFYSYSSMIANI
jgi:hypothetical protein